MAINDINIIVNRTLASDLIAGSISALNYASKLKNLVLSVFASAITTVIFPLLAEEFSGDNIAGVKKIMGYGVNIILLITIPAAVGLIVLSTPIVQIAFQRGAFTAEDTMMTSYALVFYSLGLVASSLRLLITRVYYSLHDTRTPMINGAISVLFNVILNLILVRYMAHGGLALGMSISTTIATLLMFYGLKKKIGSLGTKGFISTFYKSGLASLAMGIIVYILYNTMYTFLGVSKLHNLISLLFAIGVGIILYVVFCYLFKIREIRDVVIKLRDILFK